MTKKNKETFGNPDNRDQNVNESFANNISIVKNPNYKPGEEFDSFGATKTAKEFLAELGNRVTIDDPTDSIIFSNTISFANGAKISLPANVGIIANGTLGSAGQVLTTNGSAAYWATSNGGGGGNGSVNTAASYTWTNNHTFTTNTNGNVYIGLLTNSVNPQLKGSGIVVANGGLYLAGKTAASNSEGGDISLGYANKVFDTNSMSLSNTWSIDVFGYKDNTVSTPNSFRIFNYDSVGTTHSAIEIIPQEGGGSVVPNKIVLGSNKFITSNTTIPFAVNFCGPIGPLTANESIDFGSVTNKWGNAYFSNVIISTKGANISSQLVMVAGSGSVLNMGSDGLDGRPAPNNAGVFVAQNDRTFAFYSTLTTGAGRPIWAIRTEADPTVPPDTEATGNPGDKLGTGFFLEAPLVLRNGIVPYGSGSKGSNGQVLISTGNTFPGVKWQDISAVTVNTTARYTWTNTHTFTNVVTFSSGINAGGNTGANGQVLTSNGTAVLWTNAGSGSVNTAAQYIWTNTHTFTNLITISTNGGTSNGYMKWGEDNTSFVTLNLQPSDNNFVFYRSTAGGNSTGEPVMAWFYNPDPANTFQKSVTFTQDIMLFGGIYDNYGGSKGTAGQILSATGNSTGQGVKWINAVAGSVNTAAQYTWTNTHTFNSTATFNGTISATKYNLAGGGSIGNNGTGISVPGNIQADGSATSISVATAGGVQAGFYAGGAGKTCGFYIGTDNATHMACGTIATTLDAAGNFFIPGYLSPPKGIYATNGLGSSGQVLTSTGSGVQWSTAGGGGTAPGNKGPITVSTDASWSLNAGVVQNTNLAGGITPDKLATTGGYGFTVEGGTMTKIFAGGGAATMFGNNDFYFPSKMVYKPGGGPFESGSDLRTKKNIVTYSDGLEAILSLKPINYQFNGLVEYSPDDGKTHVGLIAQDVLETPMSYMISTHINKTKGKEGKYDGPELETYSIDTASIPFALINAVKELNSLVTNLTEENKKLRADMDSLLNKTQTKKK